MARGRWWSSSRPKQPGDGRIRSAPGGSRGLDSVGEVARSLGLRVPEIALAELAPVLGRNEPDYEIHEFIKSSAGLLSRTTPSLSFGVEIKPEHKDRGIMTPVDDRQPSHVLEQP